MKQLSIYKHLRQTFHSLVQASARSSGRRRWHERSGRLAELIAAVFLIAKGYRILAWRQRTPFGELDLIALRGKRLAFVEVKLRRNHSAAEAAIGARQAQRMARAAEHWVWRNRRYRSSRIGLDAIYLTRYALPHHACDVLQPV